MSSRGGYTWLYSEPPHNLPTYTRCYTTHPAPLVCTDDIILISESTRTRELWLNAFIPALQTVGLSINATKSKLLTRAPGVVNQPASTGQTALGPYIVQRVHKLRYLGAFFKDTLHRPCNVEDRIKAGRRATAAVAEFISHNNIRWPLALQLYRTVVGPAMLFGLKHATLTKHNRTALRRAERASLRFIWTACPYRPARFRVSSLLKGKTITKMIQVHRIRYWGHICRRHLLRRADAIRPQKL